MATFHQVRAYISYWLNAVDEHSLHSPFFYDLYTKTIRSDKILLSHSLIEDLREVLYYNDSIIEVSDPGAGSVTLRKNQRPVYKIARSSLSPKRLSRLYQRVASHFNAQTIVELGTSFGINAIYLASRENSKIFTFEGAAAIATIARRTFAFGKVENVQLVEGNISQTLPHFINPVSKIDMVLIDANHRYEPTIQYFQWLLPAMHPGSLMILDDIHLSEEMEKAWEEIKKNSLVYGSADLFRCGIVFFDPSLNGQHVVLKF